MCALVDDRFFYTGHSVEDDGPRAAFDVVDGRLNYRGADGGGDSPAEEGGGQGGHCGCVRGEMLWCREAIRWWWWKMMHVMEG